MRSNLTAASHVMFAELDWVPGKLAQKEDRAHRIGQKDSVLCSYLVLEGSLDAHMAKVNVEKMKVIDAALDRDTGFVEEDITALPAARRELYNYQRRSKVFVKTL